MIRKIVAAIAVAGVGVAAAAGVAQAKGPGKPGDNPFAPGGTIVAAALAVHAANGQFSYLLGAVGCLTSNGQNPVVEALTGNDMLTLFAPTDAAFVALQTRLGVAVPSPDATCSLDLDVVADVLTYHVTYGRRFANSVFNGNHAKPLEMLNGDFVTANPGLTLADVDGQSVGVVPGLVNINAINGVIHVVDTVLLPFDLP